MRAVIAGRTLAKRARSGLTLGASPLTSVAANISDRLAAEIP